MPRSRGGSGGRSSSRAPGRPIGPTPQRPTSIPPQQQARGVSTTANSPNIAQQAPAQQGGQPGLLGNLASTAALVFALPCALLGLTPDAD